MTVERSCEGVPQKWRLILSLKMFWEELSEEREAALLLPQKWLREEELSVKAKISWREIWRQKWKWNVSRRPIRNEEAGASPFYERLKRKLNEGAAEEENSLKDMPIEGGEEARRLKKMKKMKKKAANGEEGEEKAEEASVKRKWNILCEAGNSEAILESWSRLEERECVSVMQWSLPLPMSQPKLQKL